MADDRDDRARIELAEAQAALIQATGAINDARAGVVKAADDIAAAVTILSEPDPTLPPPVEPPPVVIPPTPAPGWDRPGVKPTMGLLSGFSEPVSDLALHPKSAAIVAATTKNFASVFNLHRGSWSVPVYQATGNETRRDAVMQASWVRGHKLTNIPYNSAWTPAGSGDNHMAIIDADGCEFGFWGWSPPLTPGTAMALKPGVGMALEHGIFNSASRATAGLIFPEELERAAQAKTCLGHALTSAFSRLGDVLGNYVDWSVPPCRSGKDYAVAADRVPTGARFRLDPSFNVETFGTDEYTKVLLRTMQVYGIIARDGTGSTGGIVVFGAQSKTGTIPESKWNVVAGKVSRWSQIDLALPKEAMRRLQLVAHGARVTTWSAHNSADACAGSRYV